ncbi:MAG: flavodoxin family protein [Deltaproteobacteria bacterium]|nr:flavodoxin family protein [Deltaproteobacteria bacterium]
MIVAVAGSGRGDGNSARLLERALEAARGSAAREVRYHRLSEAVFRGCVGCGACRAPDGPEGCALADDLTPILADTATASALLLAAPIYYGYPSGLFKAYLDRWYSFRGPGRKLRVPADRPALLILTQGHTDPNAYPWTVQSLEKVLAAYALRPSLLIGAGLEEAGAVDLRRDLLDEASRRGAALV